MLASLLSPTAAVLIWCASGCAFATYLAALVLGQKQVNTELTAFLGSHQKIERPLILFLRSFNIARSGLFHRVVMPLLSFVMILSGETGASDFVPYDIEEEIDAAIGPKATFVAIGSKRISYGSAKITVNDENWQDMYRQLTTRAWLILIMPGPTEAALWELSEIVRSPDLLKKTIFVMPPSGFAELWPTMREYLAKMARHSKAAFTNSSRWSQVVASATDYGVALPRYKEQGGCFRLELNGHPDIRMTDLEAFTRALSKYMATGQGALSADDLWSSIV